MDGLACTSSTLHGVAALLVEAYGFPGSGVASDARRVLAPV